MNTEPTLPPDDLEADASGEDVARWADQQCINPPPSYTNEDGSIDWTRLVADRGQGVPPVTIIDGGTRTIKAPLHIPTEPVPLGEGWTTGKLAPAPRYELATTEYVDQQVAKAVDSIRDSMDTSGKWVNRRIAEEIAKEKASFYRFLLHQAVCFMVGIVIGWLVTGWLWDSMA